MDNLLIYLLKSNLSLVVLFSIYMLVLRTKPNFKLNRIYLLFSVLASVLVPLIDFTTTIQTAVYFVELPEFVVGSSVQNTTFTFNSFYILTTIFVSISLVLIVKLIWDLRSIYIMRRTSKPIFLKDQSRIIWINPFQNFSFFNWIFIREDDQNNQAIIEHEQGHSKLLHSVDIVFVKVFQSLFWFNPLTFLIERELRLQHEYEVDQLVLLKHKSIPDYQQMLLNQVFQTEFNLVTNNFNQSFLKNRFTMMTKQVNKKRNPLFMSMILIMVVMIPVLFSCSMEKSELTAPETEAKIVDQKSQEAPENVQTDQIEEAETDETFMVVEDMPTFPGGQQALYKFIGENLEYPEEAKLEGIQGRVIIGFVVEKDGSISNVETVEGIGHGCDEAAMKVIEAMPNWNPGKQRGKAVRVAYRIPMKFTLQ